MTKGRGTRRSCAPPAAARDSTQLRLRRTTRAKKAQVRLQQQTPTRNKYMPRRGAVLTCVSRALFQRQPHQALEALRAKRLVGAGGVHAAHVLLRVALRSAGCGGPGRSVSQVQLSSLGSQWCCLPVALAVSPGHRRNPVHRQYARVGGQAALECSVRAAPPHAHAREALPPRVGQQACRREQLRTAAATAAAAAACARARVLLPARLREDDDRGQAVVVLDDVVEVGDGLPARLDGDGVRRAKVVVVVVELAGARGRRGGGRVKKGGGVEAESYGGRESRAARVGGGGVRQRTMPPACPAAALGKRARPASAKPEGHGRAGN